MKKVLAAVLVMASSAVFAQSNTKGTIHLGLGWGGQLGGGTIKTEGNGYSNSQKGVGVRGNYNLRVGYGLANAFSLGIFVRTESAGYVVSDSDLGGDDDLTYISRGVGFGLEPKVYAVNNDKFNLYFALPIGFSTGKGYNENSTADKTTLSGLNYGLNAGFNWYWADFIGMSLDLGYSAVALKGTQDNVDIKLNSGGLYFGVGLVSKFGGN